MKVVLDNIVFSLQKTGGISVYWNELIKRITNNNDIQVEMMGCPNGNIFGEKYTYLQRKESKIPVSILRYLPFRKEITEKSIFHSSYYRVANSKKAINVTTVHDFTYEYFSKGLRKKIHCWQKYQAIKKSDAIICISENTKQDLLRFVPFAKTKIIKVIPNGISDEYHPTDCKKGINIPFEKNSYFLYVGSRAGYKNFFLAAEAVSHTNLNLIIVGSNLTEKEKNKLNEMLDTNRYYVLENISNQALNVLYNNAFCLLYLSAYEGFGIPVLESQKAGCPVIAYNGSSIPEVIGETPLLLNKLTLGEVLTKIALLQDVSIRKHIIEKGIKNSRKYTWDKTYKQIIDLYEEIWHHK